MATDDADGPIRLGMVGGGEGAFIGGIHRIAARLDGHFVLVAGALSSDPQRARSSAAPLGIAPERTYTNFARMAKAEAARDDGIEAVAIVTPNHLHFAPAKAFLEAGIHVICDKPLTSTLRDAEALARAAAASDRLFVLTHNYTGYPMVRQAREMVAGGELGTLRLVQVEYVQDWLTEPVEEAGQKQAAWRTDPARAGAGGCVGDIGTHAYHLARFVSGLEVTELAAELSTFVDGRALDDNVNVLLRFAGGAKGTLWASQVAPGSENGLRLRIYGSKGGLEWEQEVPDRLWFTPFDEPKRLITRGSPAATGGSTRLSRVPAGHPEGYLEGFANIYAEAAAAIRAQRRREPLPPGVLFPTIEDGLEGMRFIDACIRSSSRNAAWVDVSA